MASVGKKTPTVNKAATSAVTKKPAVKKTVTGVTATPKSTAVTEAKKTVAKPPAVKAAAKKVSSTKAVPADAKPAKTPAVKKAAPNKNAVPVSPEHRYHMIATAAYFLAERRGFAGGYEMHDWISAEAEVDARLKQS